MTFAMSRRRAVSAGASPTPELLWWKLNDGAGTNIDADVGPDGTTNGPSWITGKSGSGNALSFTTNDHAYSNSAITFGTNEITVCAWVYFDSFNDSSDVLFELGDSSLSDTPGFGFITDDNPSKMTILMRDTSNNLLLKSCSRPATGSWVHIALHMKYLTGSGNSIANVYFDGVLQTMTTTLDQAPATSNFGTYILRVGSRGGSALFFEGDVDDIRIYSGNKTADLAAIMADAN